MDEARRDRFMELVEKLGQGSKVQAWKPTKKRKQALKVLSKLRTEAREIRQCNAEEAIAAKRNRAQYSIPPPSKKTTEAPLA